MVNNPLQVKDGDLETLLTSIKTAVEIIDNFISGTKGLVTEDNSLAIKTAVQVIDNFISGSRGLVTEDNSLSIKNAVQTIDNFISGARGLVTEDNSLSIKNSSTDIKTAVEKIAKEEIDDDDIAKAQTKNAQIILLYYFDSNDDKWKRVNEKLFRSGGLSINGEGNLGLDVGGVATALGGIAVGGVAAGASVLLDSGGNPVHQKSELDDNSIDNSLTLPTMINLGYSYYSGTGKWKRIENDNFGKLYVRDDTLNSILTLIKNPIVSWDESDRAKVRLNQLYPTQSIEYTATNIASNFFVTMKNDVFNEDNDVIVTNVTVECNDNVIFNNSTGRGINVMIRADNINKFGKPLFFDGGYLAVFNGSTYYVYYSEKTNFLIPADTTLTITFINTSGVQLNNLVVGFDYYII